MILTSMCSIALAAARWLTVDVFKSRYGSLGMAL